jgi:hypothetical protein
MFTGREFAEKSSNMYYAVIRKHSLEDTEENRFLFNRGFYLGAQYAMHTSSELSPHVARFLEFMMWLTERDEDALPSDSADAR